MKWHGLPARVLRASRPPPLLLFLVLSLFLRIVLILVLLLFLVLVLRRAVRVPCEWPEQENDQEKEKENEPGPEKENEKEYENDSGVARASRPCSGRRRFAPSTGKDARATFYSPLSNYSDRHVRQMRHGQHAGYRL
ncbi:hypothetical protein OPIT5_02030 [Opitutaceae bacterium TAV5]|nr:hypothetical protein OPIT5_02030 [Opitutaceae bacterium TAV5]